MRSKVELQGTIQVKGGETDILGKPITECAKALRQDNASLYLWK